MLWMESEGAGKREAGHLQGRAGHSRPTYQPAQLRRPALA
jgi:hypothetical protein